MRTITLLLSFMCIACSAIAQRINGKIVDEDTQLPVEYATIVLQTPDSVFVDAAYSDSLGEFSFSQPINTYRLIAQHLMYHSVYKELSSSDAGTIEMSSNTVSLNEVTVTGERPLVKVIDGKMTYDMPQLLQNKTATNAYDALLELPGVYEQNNAITLAGSSGVTVIVNGKPSSMSSEQFTAFLKSLPKERIASAEVMYKAPPQYHVRGAAINLVLTSGTSEKPNLQGQVNAGYSQYHYADYEGGVSLMYATHKSSTDFMYQYSDLNHRSGLSIYSHHTLNSNEVYDIEQHNSGCSKNDTYHFRLGNEYHFNADNKLSVAYTAQIKDNARSLENSNGTYSNSRNEKTPDRPAQMHNVSADYTSGFGLSTGMDYTYFKCHTTQHYAEMMTGKEDEFKAQAKQNIQRITVYADQSHTLANDWTLEYGTKFSYASDKSAQRYHSLTDNDNLSALNTDSKIDEYTYELYGGFSKAFSPQLSLKAYLTGEYYKHKQNDYWSVCPELELTYVKSGAHIFQLAIGADKSYPPYWEMINSISYLNGYTELHGNPDLKPSRSYEIQLSYILKSKYIFTLYGSYIDDYFVQLPYQSPERLALIYKTTNFDYKEQIGLSAILPFRIGSVLDSRLALNGFYDKAKSSNFHDTSFSKDNVVMHAALNNTINISSTPNIKAEVNGAYITKNIQGPSTLSKLYRMDAGIKWVSNNNKVELRLKVNDIFNSWSPKEWKMNYDKQDLNMRMFADNRYVNLSFTYRFGGYKESKRKEMDTSRFGAK